MIPATTIEFVGCHATNFEHGRRGQQPTAILNHVMLGTLAGTIRWFNQQHPAGAASSSNYGIGTDGRVVCFVRDGDTAYANGPLRDPNLSVMPWLGTLPAGDTPNHRCISLEWEGTHVGGQAGTVRYQGQPLAVDLLKGTVQRFWVPSEVQYQAGLTLIRQLCNQHQIPLDRAHIGRHSDADSVRKWFCPGEGFPLKRLLHDLGVAGY